MSLDFLLEIGVEEIPHWMIPSAVAQLAKMDLYGATASVDATPRRLVMRASGLPLMTSVTEEYISGPSVTAGEKAASGFAKKHGLQVSDLLQRNDRYWFVKRNPDLPVSELLAQMIPATIWALPWPKTMYWTGKNGPRFIRPIRWVVALLGGEVIPFDVAGVKSGSITRGHRILGSKSIPVTTANYDAKLRKNFVILSSDERRKKIESETAALGAKPDADLLETLTFITEYPTAIKGDFDAAYLDLPAEVLTTVMKHHQKYFSVESAPGVLANHFVAVMNTSGDPEGLVKKGNERVLKARFNDARFFWKTDSQRALIDRVADLERVTFHAKLGSYYFKTERVKALVESLGGDANAQSAAWLCKADLTTEMVKEFTDLQGIVGGLYAKAQGEPEEVWRAVYDHYKPLSMEDTIPATREGQLVALADKLDTLQQCFRIGLVPTGSKDPLALRRAAQGVVKILAEAKLNFSLDQLGMEGELRSFFVDRVQHYFREICGFKYDEVNAVMARVRDNPFWTVTDLQQRLVALSAVRPTENFEPLAASFKRIQNILKQADFAHEVSPNTALFEDGPERELFNEFTRVTDANLKNSDYKANLETIASIRPAVDAFFNNVLVNAKDPAVRINRLTLLHSLLANFSTIADFSEIVTSNQTVSV